MTNQDGGNPQSFVATKSYRRFGEMCDACRRARVVGLGYGPPFTGRFLVVAQLKRLHTYRGGRFAVANRTLATPTHRATPPPTLRAFSPRKMETR